MEGFCGVECPAMFSKINHTPFCIESLKQLFNAIAEDSNILRAQMLYYVREAPLMLFLYCTSNPHDQCKCCSLLRLGSCAYVVPEQRFLPSPKGQSVEVRKKDLHNNSQ